MMREAPARIRIDIARAIAFLGATLLFSGCVRADEPAQAASFSVGSFNIHYISRNGDLLPWDDRKPAVRSIIDEIDVDLLAFQEMETFSGGSIATENLQLDFVLAQFPRYAAAAVGAPEEYPSTQPILYRTDRFTPLDQGFFFFSPAPDEIYSRPWHARFPAFASWVRFDDRVTGVSFVVYNVHFDASSPRNRTKSARLVAERVADRRYADDPVIVLGDFNAPRFFPSMGILRRAGLHRAATTGSTFHFNRGVHIIPGIDHILGSDGVAFADPTVARARYDGIHPSDHYPIRARATLTAAIR